VTNAAGFLAKNPVTPIGAGSEMFSGTASEELLQILIKLFHLLISANLFVELGHFVVDNWLDSELVC
jgi:hypothetical protein